MTANEIYDEIIKQMQQIKKHNLKSEMIVIDQETFYILNKDLYSGSGEYRIKPLILKEFKPESDFDRIYGVIVSIINTIGKTQFIEVYTKVK